MSLGIAEYEKIKPFTGLGQFPKLQDQDATPTAEIQKIKIDHLYFKSVVGLLRFSDVMVRGQAAMPKVGGVVVFGGSKLALPYVNAEYRLAYWLGSNGIPVVTGGSGGAKVVANTGAFDAGGDSIGIPVGRGLLLPREKE
jgi:hypothetical protein